MNERYIKHLVSPVTHKSLREQKDVLVSSDGKERFSVVKTVPVMLNADTVSGWHRELIEAILWQYPEEIEKMYAEIDWKSNPAETYVKWIKKLLGNKQGILSALDEYANTDTEKWIVQSDNAASISKENLKEFRRFSTSRIGKKRTESKRKAEGIFAPYPYFAEETIKNMPSVIVELATGAGGGTSAVALKKTSDCTLFTVDIGIGCLGNAIGIGKYLKQKDSLLPVCANFWYLPFADKSIDSVCTFCGLDESRENEKTISETARILKSGGNFVCVSRKDAFMRQSNILEPFGFTKEEAIGQLKKCRLYSDIDTMIERCERHGFRFEKKREFIIDDKKALMVTSFIINI